jgi:hypothetical protein
MKFAIRDDDVSFFTKPEDLEKVYDKIWEKCPISFAVIPFIKGMVSPMIPEKFWYEKKYFPIGDNSDLVSYLKEKVKEKKISIMLHGYSHEDRTSGYEFENNNFEDLYEKIKKGKEYLENLFETEINVFVPPHNTISKEGIKAVIRAKLNLAVIPSFYFNKRPWNLNTLKVFLERRMFKIRHKVEPPFVLDFVDHKEVRCFPLTPLVSFEFLKENFDIAYRFDGIFCLATHYWEFDAKMKKEPSKTQKEVFEQFYEYVIKKNNGIVFMSFNELFK